MKLNAQTAVLARQERSDCMQKISNVKIYNIFSLIAFVVIFGLCAVFGWIDVVNNLFSPSADNLGDVFKMPLTYTIVSFLFLAVLICLVVLGSVVKSRTMLLLAGVYQLLFIIAFIFLYVLTSGNVTSKALYDFITYFLTVVLIPVYGAVWHLNLWFFLIFIALIIGDVIGIVKTFKSK